ncbi:hypothetical protein TorRG33x02_322890 [Trema orientale]|uniref:Uncharacterized protein n=1 Tax=Trema orientale TaxID=63057 RepID=A0A2P5BFU0_TREOI|nr:hypothetical protein TorRG33x02_322890 [Trema orientale]
MAANKISQWQKMLTRTDILEQLEVPKAFEEEITPKLGQSRVLILYDGRTHFRNECHYMELPPLEMNVEEDDVKRKKGYLVEEVRTEHLQHILLPFFQRAAN